MCELIRIKTFYSYFLQMNQKAENRSEEMYCACYSAFDVVGYVTWQENPVHP